MEDQSEHIISVFVCQSYMGNTFTLDYLERDAHIFYNSLLIEQREKFSFSNNIPGHDFMKWFLKFPESIFLIE